MSSVAELSDRAVEEKPVVAAIEMEHAIGYTALKGSVHVCPGTEKYLFVAGGCIVVGNYLNPHEQTFVRGHDDDITCMRMSLSGKYLITGQKGHNADVVLWDVVTMRPIHRHHEHEQGVVAVNICADDSMISSIGYEGTLSFFDTSNGGVVTQMSLVGFVPETDRITDTNFGGRVQDIKRRDLKSYHFCVLSNTVVLPFHVDPFESTLTPLKINMGVFQRKYLTARYSDFGDMLLIGSESGDIAVINLQYGIISSTVRVCSMGVRDIGVFHVPQAERATTGFHYARFGPGSERSTTFFVGGGDGSLTGCRIEDHDNPKVDITSKNNLDGPISSLSIIGASPVGHSVLAATTTGTVNLVNCIPPQRGGGISQASSDNCDAMQRVSDAVTAPLGVITPHPSAPEKFVSSSQDGILRLWDLNTYRIVGKFDMPMKDDISKYHCSAVSISDGLEIQLSSWSDGCIRCHDVTDFKLLWTHSNAHRSGITSLCVSSSVKFFVTGSEEGEIKVWDIRSRELRKSMKDHKQAIVALQLFDDDMHLISASRDRTVIAWDLVTGQRVSYLETHAGPITGMLLCRNQCNVYTSSTDHTICEWDLRQKDPVKKFHYATPGSDAYCTAITRNYDERLLATGGTDQLVQLFDERTLKPISVGYGHSNTVVSTAFTADSRQVLSSGLDSCIMVWNVYQA